jgi:hypothetical protein
MLPAPLTRTRGGRVNALRLKASLYYRQLTGDEHYFLKEYKDGDYHFYDPLLGIISIPNLLGCTARAHIYVSTDGKPNQVAPSKLPQFNLAKLNQTWYRQPKTKAPQTQPTVAPQAKRQRTKLQQTTTTETPREATSICALLTRRAPLPPKTNYALISLFDGVGTALQALQQITGTLPCVHLAAEMEPSLRPVVADLLDIRPSTEWQLGKHGTPTCYLKDVWDLFSHNANPVRELLSQLADTDKIILYHPHSR